MNKSEQLCRAIAEEAHAGQKRRGGEDYINHPRRVAESLSGDYARSIAWLHDVIENTNLKYQDLINKGVPEIIASAVLTLTKEPHDNYMAYIQYLGMSRICSKVKIADILDSLSDAPTEKQVKKYSEALKFLLLR